MLITIGIILIVLWLLGFIAFHVTVGIIHLLVIAGVILIIVHLVRGRKTV
jgi:hypothetical protein